MAETATGVSWEDLVKREVFEPLELTGTGFGPPKSPSKTLDQPRGHRGILYWKTSASDEQDNTPIMGPAGTVHMTLSDLCTYATEHLRGELGTGKLLAAETYKRLHTPKLHDYACGWVVKQPTHEIPYTVYWHNGSNTMWYALVVFIPGKNMVVAVTSNDGDIKQAESAAWKSRKGLRKPVQRRRRCRTPQIPAARRLRQRIRTEKLSVSCRFVSVLFDNTLSAREPGRFTSFMRRRREKESSFAAADFQT